MLWDGSDSNLRRKVKKRANWMAGIADSMEMPAYIRPGLDCWSVIGYK